jgi:hypothetical protein
MSNNRSQLNLNIKLLQKERHVFQLAELIRRMLLDMQLFPVLGRPVL